MYIVDGTQTDSGSRKLNDGGDMILDMVKQLYGWFSLKNISPKLPFLTCYLAGLVAVFAIVMRA